jgi:four helix bundle protein
MANRSYRDLIAWQKGVDLAVEIYKATRTFPREEVYGLTSQVRRAAVSVPSNLAEGQGRRTKGEFAHFTGFSMGSLQEIETQLIIAGRLGYMQETAVDGILAASDEVARLIRGLQKSLEPTS